PERPCYNRRREKLANNSRETTMKRILLLLLLPLLLLAGCSKGDANAPSAGAPAVQGRVTTLSPQEAAAMLAQHKDMLLLDVRSPEELRDGAIERGILTPFWSLVRGTMNLPKDKPIMLVCAIGGRSYAAAQILARNGYRQVYNIRGGIIAWKDAGLPVKYF
nr:rhodanese-like domain-containing protein [Desulfobacteraceae bacterium]